MKERVLQRMNQDCKIY